MVCEYILPLHRFCDHSMGHIFVSFLAFLLLLISSFIALWPEKMLDMISLFLNALWLILWPNARSILSFAGHFRVLGGCGTQWALRQTLQSWGSGCSLTSPQSSHWVRGLSRRWAVLSHGRAMRLKPLLPQGVYHGTFFSSNMLELLHLTPRRPQRYCHPRVIVKIDVLWGLMV